MTDIEKKALALVNEVFRERGHGEWTKCTREIESLTEALCRAIEQHEQFKREVSDAIIDCGAERYLDRFILPKPDKQLRSIAADRLVYAASEYFCNRKNNLELIDAIVELAASAALQGTSHDA